MAASWRASASRIDQHPPPAYVGRHDPTTGYEGEKEPRDDSLVVSLQSYHQRSAARYAQTGRIENNDDNRNNKGKRE